MPDAPYFTDYELAENYQVSDPPDGYSVADAREVVESRFERECGVAFVPRTATETHSGTGTTELPLRAKVRSVTSATVDGVAIDVADIKATPLGAYRPAGWPAGVSNIEIVYEHGFDEPPPEVKRAALRFVQEVLRTGDNVGPTDDRAIRIDLESGSYQRAIAGRNRPTGIPDVDVVLANYNFRTPFA